MKINIASSHRFHLLDLARQLSRQGHDVRFYSYVPAKRCAEFGLDAKYCYSFTWLVVPFIVLDKLFGRCSIINYLRNIVVDYYVSWVIRPCDVYICLGTVYKHSMVIAKRKYHAMVILEWGSKHILEQLSMINKLDSYPKYALKRDLVGYQLADYISIASEHVKQSFVKHSISDEKLLVNPYGVDLSQFHPTELIPNFDVIMVGGWRREKGCDLLVKACRKQNLSLLHVGSLVNMDFPNDKNMKHYDAVNQCELIKYYSQARVFALPSRSEGLALVQAQALACGLPIVCSKETGGRDLRNLLSDKKWIIEMEKLTVDELGKCLTRAMEMSRMQNGTRDYAYGDVDKFSWDAYGKRYSDTLKQIWNEKK